jgi:hypothetical protein
MDKETLIATLQEIRALADQAMKETGRLASRRKAFRTGPATKPPSTRTLPSHILELRGRGFFKQAKTSKEVHAKLQSVYHCNLDRVLMALLRLQRRKRLRKSVKLAGKKKQVAYVW